MMHGVVSLLDKKHYQQVETIWHMLEVECGLTGVQVAPYPHFSWLVASDFDWITLEKALQEITAETNPFIVRTTGLGFFSGPIPVVFIPIVRTAELSAFHQQIWEKIEPLATDISPYYAPDIWTPHITLAYSDITPENIACTMQNLTFQTYNWEIAVDNISFMHGPNIQAGQVRFNFTLNGGK